MSYTHHITDDNEFVSTLYLDGLNSVRSGSGLLTDQASTLEESVITYDSSVDGFLFKDEYGRTFTNQSDTYTLPGDELEHRRLDLQHNLLRVYINGLYVEKERVEYALRDEPSRVPGILDVGTGSGRWAIEMARQFPNANVIGMDLVPPVVDLAEIGPNCRFEIDDANLHMGHYRNAFDYVHMRSAASGIRNFPSFMHQFAQTLRPGGVLQLFSVMEMVGEDFLPYPDKLIGEPGFSWTQSMLSAFFDAHARKGHHGYTSPLHWHSWLGANPNYAGVVTQDIYIPFNAEKTGMLNVEVLVARMMNEDLALFLHAIKPTLFSDGKDVDEVDAATRNAVQELREMRIHGYMHCRYATATRAENAWWEGPPEMV